MTSGRLPDPFVVNVCACGSSGSTLFARLLDQHPDVACGEELFLFCAPLPYEDYAAFRRWLPAIALAGLPGHPYHQGRALLRHARTYGLARTKLWLWASRAGSFREFVQRIRTHVLHRTGKRVWAEKTPRNVRVIRHFVEGFPDGRVIHVVRDPRDVVASLSGRSKGLLHAAETWLGSVGAMAPYRQHPRVLEVRYEDLCHDPAATMTRVWRWLGLDAAGEFLDTDRHASRGLRHVNDHRSWKQKPGQPLSTASVGRYRDAGLDTELLGRIRLTEPYARVLGCPQLTVAQAAASYGYDFEVSPDPPGIAYETYASRWKLSRARRWIDRSVGVADWVPMIEYPSRLRLAAGASPGS